MKNLGSKNNILTALLISLALGLAACQPNSKSGLVPDQTGAALDLNQLPETVELPEATDETSSSEQGPQKDNAINAEDQKPTYTTESNPVKPLETSPQVSEVTPRIEKPTVESKPENRQQQNIQPVQKPDTIKPRLNIKSEPSEFIKIAHEVMVKEGKKIGTPCNFYLRRVLVRAGYADDGFVANDFDIYAKKNFSSYKSQDFKIDKNGTDRPELKKYIWSFPERTPFIAQWTRPGNYGHVAIIERIGDELVIYQASINQYTARRDLTTIEKLLSSQKRAFLTLYSDFKKK